MNYLIAFCLTFGSIGFKVFQQKNVIYDKWWWVPPTSMFIQVCDVAIIVLVIQEGLSLAAVTGLGAGLGALLAMWIHNKLRKD
mgnify:CR=1 FL=1